MYIELGSRLHLCIHFVHLNNRSKHFLYITKIELYNLTDSSNTAPEIHLGYVTSALFSFVAHTVYFLVWPIIIYSNSGRRMSVHSISYSHSSVINSNKILNIYWYNVYSLLSNQFALYSVQSSFVITYVSRAPFNEKNWFNMINIVSVPVRQSTVLSFVFGEISQLFSLVFNLLETSGLMETGEATSLMETGLLKVHGKFELR